jgi:hypothetical protein
MWMEGGWGRGLGELDKEAFAEEDVDGERGVLNEIPLLLDSWWGVE